MRASVLVPVLTLLCCAAGEQPFRRYENRAEAVGAGEAERGWLPTWVPAESRSIQLQGDLDTNRVWLRFRLDPPARAVLRAEFRELSEDEIEAIVWKRPRNSSAWWPTNLIQQAPADDSALYADLFAASGSGLHSEPFVVAFEKGSDEVYAWTDRR
jgi:hypothetical protein